MEIVAVGDQLSGKALGFRDNLEAYVLKGTLIVMNCLIQLTIKEHIGKSTTNILPILEIRKTAGIFSAELKKATCSAGNERGIKILE